MKNILTVYSLIWLICLNINLNANAPQKISVIGTGYVGLVTGTCLAHFGHEVICADIDSTKIKLLNNNCIPIYEPGLTELIKEVRQKHKLSFTDNISTAIKETDIVFIAVGTPMDTYGQADLTALYEVAKSIGKNINKPKVICIKSTVPIGTGKKIKSVIVNNMDPEIEDKNKLIKIVFNPEFLKEGSAIYDCLNPDRIVLGGSKKGIQTILKSYQVLADKNVPFLLTDITTAETIKYAANAFLSIKLSYINEIAKLCDAIEADCGVVAKGIGLDQRIGDKFLRPGPGYGGSCFPKDSEALLYTSRLNKRPLTILEAAVKVNQDQVKYVFSKFLNLIDNDIENKTIALLGLAFKANTDDIRYSPAIDFIEKLKTHNCVIKTYDPIASENMKLKYNDIFYATSAEDACKNADAVIILTDWPEFKHIDLKSLHEILNKPVLFDTRNIINTDKLKELGFNYTNIGNCRVNS